VGRELEEDDWYLKKTLKEEGRFLLILKDYFLLPKCEFESHVPALCIVYNATQRDAILSCISVTEQESLVVRI